MSAPTRDAKRKLPAERRDELLAKAVEISAAEGLSSVTLRKVATELGVTPGLVSHYFSSAEQLIIAAFRAAATADLAAAQARVAAVDSAAAKLDTLMDYVFDEASADASALWLDVWSLGRRNPALAAEANQLTEQWLAWIAEMVRAGQEAGEFVAGDAEVAARRVLTIIDGLGSQQVVRAVAVEDLRHIARAFVAADVIAPVRR